MNFERDKKISELIEQLNTTCIKCGHFNEKDEMCNLYKQRPPARVIAFGCPSFDFIPF
jgi:hypothetical protein